MQVSSCTFMHDFSCYLCYNSIVGFLPWECFSADPLTADEAPEFFCSNISLQFWPNHSAECIEPEGGVLGETRKGRMHSSDPGFLTEA